MTAILDFDGINPDAWLDAMPAFQSATIKEMLAAGRSPDEVATSWLSQGGPENTAPFGTNSAPRNFYQSVNSVFAKLICSDQAYEDIRLEIAKVWNESKTTIVLLVAVAISPYVGIAVAALVPVVGILLSIVTRVGVNAWCNGCSQPKEQ